MFGSFGSFAIASSSKARPRVGAIRRANGLVSASDRSDAMGNAACAGSDGPAARGSGDRGSASPRGVAAGFRPAPDIRSPGGAAGVVVGLDARTWPLEAAATGSRRVADAPSPPVVAGAAPATASRLCGSITWPAGTAKPRPVPRAASVGRVAAPPGVPVTGADGPPPRAGGELASVTGNAIRGAPLGSAGCPARADAELVSVTGNAIRGAPLGSAGCPARADAELVSVTGNAIRGAPLGSAGCPARAGGELASVTSNAIRGAPLASDGSPPRADGELVSVTDNATRGAPSEADGCPSWTGSELVSVTGDATRGAPLGSDGLPPRADGELVSVTADLSFGTPPRAAGCPPRTDVRLVSAGAGASFGTALGVARSPAAAWEVPVGWPA